MDIFYTPAFTRQFSSLEYVLQEEATLKIEQFKDLKNHQQLRVHKLKGHLSGRYSFYVNYRYRIVFVYQGNDVAILLAIGDHEVYT
ncbi:MAG: hypothetical protein A3H59_00980 [Candidatus Jacksonbacteria bacterium RIFCSPLOWO2_02_FULL_43_9]|nr:MAG: Plasmid stabilization system [Parcubacteria group bacterium GW2011_GWA2_43_13]OGY69995.1 MAG: hypothetical protein A3B94_03430 [Candidatus Jacksonbacteria bacterium RIFCSPHIGHO2_02_FULL_43_10]OGY71072.1 MAG: hypothetical protein A2986_01210 [Candidatus Jacksonbacteria bacterium RIFCSPLOWO2_01_FULL_44_13]OGY73859.1 MAG: hypothetical protein A3H59_00980 [Candidatus Jacksonbacteria bacterium RIFCSPLOWO2_02_FULL_43_9]HAZ16781.1 plasmid stabilization protein [Candidatus Jacksonbacteria bacte